MNAFRGNNEVASPLEVVGVVYISMFFFASFALPSRTLRSKFFSHTTREIAATHFPSPATCDTVKKLGCSLPGTSGLDIQRQTGWRQHSHSDGLYHRPWRYP